MALFCFGLLVYALIAMTPEGLNQAAPGNGAIPSLLHAGRPERALPEQRC
jgi:hypothetical protein